MRTNRLVLVAALVISTLGATACGKKSSKSSSNEVKRGKTSEDVKKDELFGHWGTAEIPLTDDETEETLAIMQLSFKISDGLLTAVATCKFDDGDIGPFEVHAPANITKKKIDVLEEVKKEQKGTFGDIEYTCKAALTKTAMYYEVKGNTLILKSSKDDKEPAELERL